MVMCWAPGCFHYSERHPCRFLHFPTNEAEKKKWTDLIKRDITPSPHSKICSCHFEDGDRKNCPTIFEVRHAERLSRKRHLDDTPSEHETHLFLDPIVPIEDSEDSGDEYPSEVELSLQSEDYFAFKTIKINDKLVCLYTGLMNSKIFYAVLHLMTSKTPLRYYDGTVEEMDEEDQLFMTLIKLKLNFPDEDLALRFKVDGRAVNNILLTWIHALHEILFAQIMSQIPSTAKNRSILPNRISTFTNCRIILDLAQISVEDDPREKWKFLVGVAPNGVITYVSALYPGNCSDRKIVRHCGILNQMKEGDLILAQKEYIFDNLLLPNIHVNIPPSLTTVQHTPEFAKMMEKVEKAWIHVDRAIERMKAYSILDCFPKNLRSHGSIIVQTIAALTNLQPVIN